MLVDPALTEALGLDPSTAKMSSYGGSGFASTFKLTGTRDGSAATFFVKTGSGPDSEVMFRGKPTYTPHLGIPTHTHQASTPP